VNLFLDGSTLPVNLRQKVYANGTLTIDNVQRQTDAGTYTCQAKNHHGHSSRRDVDIQVLSTYRILQMKITDQMSVGIRCFTRVTIHYSMIFS